MQSLLRIILVEDVYKSTKRGEEKALVHQIRVGPSWMDPIMLFLRDDIFPEEKGEADKVKRKSP